MGVKRSDRLIAMGVDHYLATGPDECDHLYLAQILARSAKQKQQGCPVMIKHISYHKFQNAEIVFLFDLESPN